MKKSNIALDVLALLSLIGAHYTKYFADRKLGFVRWLNYNGAHLREALPLGLIKYALLAIAIILSIAVVIRLLILRKVVAKKDYIATAALMAVMTNYTYSTFTMDYSYSPASFLIVPLLGLGAYFLIIRNLLGAKEAANKTGTKTEQNAGEIIL